jgi:hypothetical protein
MLWGMLGLCCKRPEELYVSRILYNAAWCTREKYTTLKFKWCSCRDIFVLYLQGCGIVRIWLEVGQLVFLTLYSRKSPLLVNR